MSVASILIINLSVSMTLTSIWLARQRAKRTKEFQQQLLRDMEELDKMIVQHGPIVAIEHVPGPEPEPEPMTRRQQKAAAKDLQKLLKELKKD